MEINTLTKEEYHQDIINTQLREIFEPEKYIAQKTKGFEDVKLKLQEIIEGLLSPKNSTITEEINEKFLNLDFGAEFDIDASKIGVNDAIFFVNLLNQNNTINYSIENEKISINLDDKKINVTNSLINMLKSSLETNKAIRLDFEKDVTVILKLDKEGKIQAHFIPGTPEVEAYLKNNISCLKQTFDEEKINYSHLGYSKHKDNQENQHNKKRSKK